MPTYVTLVRFTQKGIETVKESPTRIDQFKNVFKTHGGELKEIYHTIGQYDFVTICEMPSDAAYASTLIAITAAGTARAESLRAFPEDEYHKIVAAA